MPRRQPIDRRDLLKGVAAAQPLIAREPAPQAYFIGFGGETLKFELRAWTDRYEEWTQIRSDLALGINTAFAAEHIAIK